MRKFLSIVIPCYNCEKTIDRLLQSILSGGLLKDQYKIIICDDKSTDNFLDIVKSYENIIDIMYCTTTRDFHCPGNTRQAALKYIDTEWFTFIDNDDMFEPGSLIKVKNYIEENNSKYTVVTNLRQYFIEDDKYGQEYVKDNADAWLHGKFFNTENTLHKFKCHFKDDMFSHEDVYFNNINLGNLISNDLDYEYLDIFTYKWIYRPDSLSRSYFSKKYYYIDEYLDDYICAASDAYFDLLSKDEKHRGWYINQIMMTLLHSYFYYQANIWRLGYETLFKNRVEIRNLKTKIIEQTKMSELDIINYVYKDPNRYSIVKNRCIGGTCNFVEVQSFRDFILNI